MQAGRMWTWIWGGTTHNGAVRYTPGELKLMAAALKQRGHHNCANECKRFVDMAEHDSPDIASAPIMFYRHMPR